MQNKEIWICRITGEMIVTQAAKRKSNIKVTKRKFFDNTNMQKVFYQYYSTLYKGQEISMGEKNEYLYWVLEPSLKIIENQRQIWMDYIPDPDGFSASYYKCFEDKLLHLYNKWWILFCKIERFLIVSKRPIQY